jgi:hypothetical protein
MTGMGGQAAGALATARALRPAAEIMTPDRLGMFKASGLSFGCAVVNRMIAERWAIERVRWDLDDDGRGTAVYRITTPDGPELNYVVLSVLVPLEEQVGYAYATKFDVVGSLIEGPVTAEYLDTLGTEIRKKPTEGWAGHETLTWVRANVSRRAFGAAVGALAEGRQPDVDALTGIGYLLRTVYYQANAMCGTRSYRLYWRDHPLSRPYAAQSLGSYLTREFANDLVDHVAGRASPRAATLSRDMRSYLGLGNSTGLGLVVLAVNHPRLIDRWITLRETGIALARERVERPGSPAVERMLALLDRCITYRREDRTPYGSVFRSGPELAGELVRPREWVREFDDRGTLAGRRGDRPWDLLCAAAGRTLSPEAMECIHSVLVDTYPAATDDLLDLAVLEDIDELHPEIRDVDPAMSPAELREIVRSEYDWTSRMDVSGDDVHYWRWYKAAIGEYPGVVEPDLETKPFEDYSRCIPAAVRALDADLAAAPAGTSLARFLLAHPQHRGIVQWVQTAQGLQYATPRMNMRARDYQPMEITRFVLESLKGFEKMEPVDAYGGRAIIMQGAPIAEEIAAGTSDIWMHPPVPRHEGTS